MRSLQRRKANNQPSSRAQLMRATAPLGFPTEADASASNAETALDILAQASQLEEAQTDSEPEHTPSKPTSKVATATTAPSSAAALGVLLEEPKREPSPSAAGGSTLGPAIDLRSTIEDHQIDPALIDIDQTKAAIEAIHPPHATPAQLPANAPPPETPKNLNEFDYDLDDMTSPSLDEVALGPLKTPSGATVPGLGKYVHLSSTVPARRIRSPYLKWTTEEVSASWIDSSRYSLLIAQDELLARAVATHGEKWDLVSKGVPTRSYHQVRQRWVFLRQCPQRVRVADTPDGFAKLGRSTRNL